MMIYYVSVARRKRRSSEADINAEKFCGSWNFERAGFEKKSKKFQKVICKIKNLWYTMSLSLADNEWADWKLNSAM